MQSGVHQFQHMDSPDQSWHWYAVASLACHIILIATVLFFPFLSVSMPDFSDRNVIEVDLAAIQPQTPLPPDTASIAPRRATPEPEKPADDDFVPETAEPEPDSQKAAIPVKKAPEKQFDPSDYVVEKPGPKIKHSMKKQTIQTAAVHRSAIEKLKEKSNDSRPQSVKDRIDALKSEVAGQDRKLTDRLAAKARGSSGGRGTARDMAQIEVYQAEVAVRLKNNWVFSEKLAGQTQGLESRLVIKILPDGSITEVWYEKRSGNSYLDQSAYKTVMKSDPLPPLPQGYPYYHLMVGFTPSGLKRQ